MLKRLIHLGFLLMCLTIFAIPSLAQSTDATITGFSGDCDSATVTYVSGATFVRVKMTNVDTGDTLSFTEEDPIDSVTVSFVPALASGTTVRVDVGQEFLDSEEITVSCSEPVIEENETTVMELPFVEMCDDGRTNSNLCEPIAIYPVTSPEGSGIDIWDARRTGSRGQLLYVPADALQSLPETSCLIGASPDEFAQVMWLDGVLVISAGPDFEGKSFFFIYENGFPSQPVINTTNGSTGLDLPDCNI